jgi:hypothetical protein
MTRQGHLLTRREAGSSLAKLFKWVVQDTSERQVTVWPCSFDWSAASARRPMPISGPAVPNGMLSPVFKEVVMRRRSGLFQVLYSLARLELFQNLNLTSRIVVPDAFLQRLVAKPVIGVKQNKVGEHHELGQCLLHQQASCNHPGNEFMSAPEPSDHGSFTQTRGRDANAGRRQNFTRARLRHQPNGNVERICNGVAISSRRGLAPK